MHTFRSHSENETLKFAAQIAEECFSKPAAVIELRGTLGAGKTVFAKGFIQRWMELSGEPTSLVVSPSFPLAQVYGQRKPVAHLDLFRLESAEEFEQMGGYEYLEQYSCTLVEWLDKIPNLHFSPKHLLKVEIQIDGADRVITRDP